MKGRPWQWISKESPLHESNRNEESCNNRGKREKAAHLDLVLVLNGPSKLFPCQEEPAVRCSSILWRVRVEIRFSFPS